MRVVVFDVSGLLEAFDYRGVLIHTQEIKHDLNVKEKIKQSLEHLNLDPIVLEAITETTSDELLLKAMNTAYIKKQILFCAVVARGELIKMIKRASLTNNEKDSVNIIVAAEKVSKLFIDAGVSLFGKEQIQVIETNNKNNITQMNMTELIALANADCDN
ncbi:hypothetical protein VN0387_13300 [Helicobacter pylori]